VFSIGRTSQLLSPLGFADLEWKVKVIGSRNSGVFLENYAKPHAQEKEPLLPAIEISWGRWFCVFVGAVRKITMPVTVPNMHWDVLHERNTLSAASACDVLLQVRKIKTSWVVSVIPYTWDAHDIVWSFTYAWEPTLSSRLKIWWFSFVIVSVPEILWFWPPFLKSYRWLW
jgi:hypothetical protein